MEACRPTCMVEWGAWDLGDGGQGVSCRSTSCVLNIWLSTWKGSRKMTSGVLKDSKRHHAGSQDLCWLLAFHTPNLWGAEQNQKIAAGCMSKWALWPSINDEWLPQQQPRPIFHLLEIQTSSSKTGKSQAGRERASISCLVLERPLGQVSGETWVGREQIWDKSTVWGVNKMVLLSRSHGPLYAPGTALEAPGSLGARVH